MIRGARPDELEAVLALVREAALPENGLLESFGSFLVATRAGRVVGCSGLERHGEYGLLRSVVVARGERGGGLGRRLVEAAFARAGEQRLKCVYLLTTTARDFFTRSGFAVASRDAAPESIRVSWAFVAGCPSTATFMARDVPTARPG